MFIPAAKAIEGHTNGRISRYGLVVGKQNNTTPH